MIELGTAVGYDVYLIMAANAAAAPLADLGTLTNFGDSPLFTRTGYVAAVIGGCLFNGCPKFVRCVDGKS